MTSEAWWPLAAGLLLLFAGWVAWTLTRLRRLYARVGRAWQALDAQLQRRAGLAEVLGREHAAAVGEERAVGLTVAAADTRAPREGDRELAENVLGRLLRALPADLPGVPGALQLDLAGTATRVGLARRFYNDAVRDTRDLRQRRLPRVLRLYAHRPLPRFFDIDDDLDRRLSSVGRPPG